MLSHGQGGMRVCLGLLFLAGLPAAAQSRNEVEFESLLKQGFQLHQEARFAQAIPILERARKLEPDDYFANLLLGIDLLRTDAVSQSLPYLKLAARIKPAEEIPEDYLGEAEAKLGDYAEAAQAYMKAIADGNNSEQSLEVWADFALERFHQIGEQLRTTSPGVAIVRRLQSASNNPSRPLVCGGSIPALERNLAAESTNPPGSQEMETAYKLSICYAVAAGDAAGRLQGSAQNQAAVDELRGDVLLRVKGDAPGAEAEYKKAIALRPADPALKERLAESELLAGDTKDAQASAEAALAIDPQRPEAMRVLSSLAMFNRDYTQALPWLRRLAAESPGDRAVQVQLGRAYAETGNASEALRCLEPALAAGYPDEKGALHALEARALLALGRDAEASKAEAEARRLSDAFQAHKADKPDQPGGGPDVDH